MLLADVKNISSRDISRLRIFFIPYLKGLMARFLYGLYSLFNAVEENNHSYNQLVRTGKVLCQHSTKESYTFCKYIFRTKPGGFIYCTEQNITKAFLLDMQIRTLEDCLKGQCHEFFCFWFFS
jgi:hypothetical protein